MRSTKFIIEELKVLLIIVISTIISLGAIVVYDCSDADTFKKMSAWVAELKNYLSPNTPIIIAGNKCDSKAKVVTEEEARNYAKTVNS